MPAPRTVPEPPVAATDAPPGESGFLRRAEVRDVLAWVRLLVDPHDAAAVVRALARPPIELRQAHLARVIQLARRRKLDLVAGLGAAIESPQVPPEARERIERFVALHDSAAAGLERLAPDEFVRELIELIGTPSRALLTPDDAAEQRASLQGLRDLAGELFASAPQSSSRELARRLAAVVPEARGAIAAGEGGAPAHVAQAAGEEERSIDELLHERLRQLRDELLEGVGRIGGRLGELRLDTELDVAHGVVRYLELLKLSALTQRPAGQSLQDALADVNARLLAAATPLQREILQTSTLDEWLLAGSRSGSHVASREEHSLEPFLPRKGVGLALSASDIETYRSCPLRYKFARVLRIPTEQTLHQRFGIVVHQVLERFHAGGEGSLAQMHDLLDAGWRRSGFGETDVERGLREKGRAALAHYVARLREHDAEPVWFERSFAFRLGPHHLRGRVDRVDRIAPAGGEQPEYELIDYKTSRPKSAEQLEDDVQLSLYAIAAREDWRLPSSRAAYYYVLDDVKVPVPCGERDEAAVTDLVMQVGEGILAQEFEPTPSHAACSLCDYRIVCPAAER